MAPEIIRGIITWHGNADSHLGMSYGLEVDMWAIGVIAFVMMGGYVPFDGDNDSEVFASILGLKFYFQSPEWDHVGQDGRDFIRSLLKLNPADRLTSRQALSHSFITKYTPEALRMIPPLPSESPGATHTDGPNGRVRTDSAGKNNSKIKTQVVATLSEKLDLTKNPRQSVLDRISNLSKNIGKDDVRSGELKYMKNIVNATGTCTSKLEVAILEETWERLNIIQNQPATPPVKQPLASSTTTKKGKKIKIHILTFDRKMTSSLHFRCGDGKC